MKKGTIVIIVIAVLVVLIIGWIVGFYNSVIRLSQAVDNQWAQVETQYQRRLDLIPNLVESVKGIFKQEKDVFGALADARTKYAGAVTVNEKALAATEVESALARLLAIIENYPELRSTETVSNLMVQLEGTENRVSVERKRFNDVVRQYNVKIKVFPANLLARVFGFEQKEFFKAAEGAEEAPKVEF